MVWQRQFSPPFDTPELPNAVGGPTPRFQSIMILSSPADASVTPDDDHRTALTHAKWLSNWHSFCVTPLDCSEFSSITGSKFQITTWPVPSLPCPPVVNLVPSGCMSMENIGFPNIFGNREKKKDIDLHGYNVHLPTVPRLPVLSAIFFVQFFHSTFTYHRG